MECTLAQYEHSTIGFPGVKLKWSEVNGKYEGAYYTVAGIMAGTWPWHNPYPETCAQFEMQRFDDFVRNVYGRRVDLQG